MYPLASKTLSSALNSSKMSNNALNFYPADSNWNTISNSSKHSMWLKHNNDEDNLKVDWFVVVIVFVIFVLFLTVVGDIGYFVAKARQINIHQTISFRWYSRGRSG